MITFKEPKVLDGFWPAIIAAGASLVGGILSNKSQSSATEKNIDANEKTTQMNIDYQKEFAQHGVKWRADDAREAGIDPLAAMGSPSQYYPTNYQPLHSGKDYSYLGKMGQDVSRAIQSTQSKEERELQDLALQRARLENKGVELRNAEIEKRLNESTQVGPAMPNAVDDYGEASGTINNSSVRVQHVPDQRTRSAAHNAGETAATQPFVTQWLDNEGRLRETIAERAAESVESDWVGWAENNAIRAGKKIKSYFVRPDEYPKRKPPAGHVWEWKVTPTGGYWFAVKKGKPGTLRWQGKSYKHGRAIHHGRIWK